MSAYDAPFRDARLQGQCRKKQQAPGMRKHYLLKQGTSSVLKTAGTKQQMRTSPTSCVLPHRKADNSYLKYNLIRVFLPSVLFKNNMASPKPFQLNESIKPSSSWSSTKIWDGTKWFLSAMNTNIRNTTRIKHKRLHSLSWSAYV